MDETRVERFEGENASRRAAPRAGAGVPSKRECANSALRVMGDSLSSKFDFRPIISEREARGEGGGGGDSARLNDERAMQPARRRGNLKQLTANPGSDNDMNR